MISVLLNLSYSFSCCLCNFIRDIVVLFTFSIRIYGGIISVVFKKHMFLTWFEYMEQDVQKKFPPFVKQHQTGEN